MNPEDYEQMRHRNICPDHFDRELDAAVSRYANVEPRFGLEKRIMANLQAAQDHAPVRLWWRWPSAALALVVIVLAVSIRWRSSKPARYEIAGPAKLGTVLPHVVLSSPISPQGTKKGSPRSKPRGHGVTNSPKLEQFPSPQPLSEQEKVLADYVARFRDEAVLIARVNSEELMRDRAEMTDGSGASTDLTQFDEKETTNQ
jgi:hypothetical protein